MNNKGFTLIRTRFQRNLVNVKGFTLIELLITISIIIVLAGLSAFGLRGAYENARNTQRLSDLKQYQTGLEAYSNLTNGLYKARNSGTGTRMSTILCTDLGMTSGSCPEDPLYVKNPSSWSFYTFETNGTDGTVNATSYVMWGRTEENITMYYVVCSNGKSGKVATAPNDNNGTCPL